MPSEVPRAEPLPCRQTVVLPATRRYAFWLRWAVQPRPFPPQGRPAVWPPVHLQEPHGRPPQGPVLGRTRAVLVVPTPRSRTLPLPRTGRRPGRHRTDRRPVSHDPRGHRPQRRTTVQTLFPQFGEIILLPRPGFGVVSGMDASNPTPAPPLPGAG